MDCHTLISDGPEGRRVVGHVCTARTPRRRCEFCRELCVPRLCDFRLGGQCDKCKGKGKRGGGRCFACTGTGILTCNRVVCAGCAEHVEGEDRDYCPRHRVAAGFKLRRESCEWAQADTTAKCIHKGCGEVVVEGERCMWFTRRRKPMCLECGAKYLEVSE